ncbi:hypothetical protein mru_1385 [Methanobrevibacter ruminantium M1]|uniref:DUF7575 domain-containing protein n=1 Tax=Methanobrevibacter ruminantium (strain ATCC 35063 / DSM 1093 / JCM 13430 / OCM 146 / M1) TaxID=634498 RepID=D3E3X4_METRM|nr:hypothetical protein [Methanobrevibacter ruminantium]ADC47235.1 hypothetical protein mru_1385 [Methanobrevibacter ruminantium M1]
MAAIICPRCGKMNDGSLDFCIYCGTYFDDYNEEDNNDNLFFIRSMTNDGRPGKKQVVRLNEMPDNLQKPKHRLAILLGYLFAILGGLIGFVFAIYLITRKDKNARRHGLIQLVILLIEYALIGVLILNGQLDINMVLDPFNMTRMNNITQLYNSSQMNVSGSNISSLFGF